MTRWTRPRAGAEPRSAISFRSFAESASYCGLELSPLIAATMDASEGHRVALDDAACLEFFGCTAAALPREPRRTVAVRAGGRSGKTSRLLAVKALHAAWTAPLPFVMLREKATAIIVAPDLKLAKQALSFVGGYVDGSPILREARVEETAEHITLKRPDKRLVRIEVLAASRQGRSTRGRTVVFAGLDEACFFFDEATGLVNDSEIYRSLLQRVVKGGSVWVVSTPWLAGVGLLEGFFARDHGAHENALCVTGGTRAFNPQWDPDGTIERDLRAVDADAAAREIDGIPSAGGAGTFFDGGALLASVVDKRALVLAPAPSVAYAAGADFGFERDSSALVIGHMSGETFVVDLVEELRPTSAPLKPSAVVRAFAEHVHRYGVNIIVADGHYRASILEHLEPEKIALHDAPGGADGKASSYVELRALVHEGRLEMPRHPKLLRQLQDVIARPLPGGGVRISSPRRPGGHGDLVSALVLAAWQARRASILVEPKWRPGVTRSVPLEDRPVFDDGDDGGHYGPADLAHRVGSIIGGFTRGGT